MNTRLAAFLLVLTGLAASACVSDIDQKHEAPLIVPGEEEDASTSNGDPDSTNDNNGTTDPTNNGTTDPTNDGNPDAGNNGTTDPANNGNPDPVSGSEVGGTCSVAGDCADANSACFSEANGFPGGYCVVEGCSQGSCPDGSSCWGFQDEVSRCLQNCVGHEDCRDGYMCDQDNVCWPGCTPGSCPDGMTCGSDGQCAAPECTPGSCALGLICTDGKCVIDLGQVPQGTPPACTNVPDWECTGTAQYCAELVAFEPDQGPGFWDYPINGETGTNEYRSYIRRDVMMIVKYAAGMVDCVAQNWAGNGGMLGLGDMSEPDGSIPGTSVGSPGHPQGTHVNGFDMDIAYYQVNTPDNKLRPVCNHVVGMQDQYHCVSEPYLLDVWRTALFLAHLHDAVIHNSFQMRVIGVDGKIGPPVKSAIQQLCSAGWYSGYACNQDVVTYEETNMSRGWYHFHHHHLHISTNGLHASIPPYLADEDVCLAPQCSAAAPIDDPRRLLEYE